MVVSTVFGKIISIFIIMLVGVLCFKVGIIDNTTKEKMSRLSTQIVNPILIFMSFQMDYDALLIKKWAYYFSLPFLAILFLSRWHIFFLRRKKAMT